MSLFENIETMTKLVEFVPWIHECLILFLDHAQELNLHLQNAEMQAHDFRGKTDNRILELQTEL